MFGNYTIHLAVARHGDRGDCSFCSSFWSGAKDVEIVEF